MSQTYDVIIAGAGPVGLFLCTELALSGASVLVLERDQTTESPWKSMPLGRRGMNTPTVESFYRRGLYKDLTGTQERPESFNKRPGFTFGGHFAGIPLNANDLELNRWKYRLPGPALMPHPTSISHIEELLTPHAYKLGVDIRRGAGVAKVVSQDDEGITVESEDGQTYHGKWLVGCDGGRSVVRHAAEFDFVGTNAKFTGYLAECTVDHPEKLKSGFQVTRAGLYINMGESMYLVDFDGGAFDRKKRITVEHLQEVFDRVTGVEDTKIMKLGTVGSFTDRCMQATSYRKGRVLLAGDAAHIHSPLGAQGMNLGLGDAFNLGWKLAATIRHEKQLGHPTTDFTLLDSYETERHPIGEWALNWTRAQVQVLQPDQFGWAMQSVIRELIGTTDGANVFLDRSWGLSLRYTLGNGSAFDHPLIGASAPDVTFADGTRLGPKMVRGRGLLVDFTNIAALKEILDKESYCERVDYVAMDAKDTCGLGAFLVRPDGMVAWLFEENATPDLDATKAALKRWFAF